MKCCSMHELLQSHLLEDFNLQTVELRKTHDYGCECDDKCEEEKAHLMLMQKKRCSQLRGDVAIEFAPLRDPSETHVTTRLLRHVLCRDYVLPILSTY